MIRKAFIVVLTLGTMGVAILQVVSFGRIIHWPCFRSQGRHICIELHDGNAFVHYAYSQSERFLDLVDEHEAGYPRRLGGHQDVSYAESEHPWNPEMGELPTPMRTYAWTYRFGFPLFVFILLFVPYPAVAFFRGPFRRWRRHCRGMCLKCGYNLLDNISGVCPECGTAVPGECGSCNHPHYR